MKIRLFGLTLLLLAACSFTSMASACTGIRIKATDGSIVYARTMEFGGDFHSNVIVVPRAKEFVGSAPDNKPGLRWASKYATVGANAFNMPVIVDGLNEKGLGVGIFYMPGYAKYQAVNDSNTNKAIAPWEVPLYVLGNCATVQEAVAALQDIRVVEVFQGDFGFVPQLHYIVHDNTGACVVLEYVEGELKVHEDPLGVITNSPTFDWHLTNLSNYINLTVNNVPPVDFKGTKFIGFGQGSGMLGLPGDFTPPSRFVRAVAFTQSALPVETAQDAVLQAFHILNQFDIPKGCARSQDNGKEAYDYTLWTTASDLANHCYYFHTFENRRIRMVDLKKMDLDAKDIKTFPMAGKEAIEDLSDKAM